jgi:putative oxidoreductase
MFKKFLKNNILTFISRVIVGFVFIVAAIPKIADPNSFVRSIEAYQAIPLVLIIPTALVVPWLEFVIGVFLIIGLWQRGSSFLSALLFFMFTILIGVSLWRGLAIDCGCFGAGGSVISWKRLLEDAILFLLSIQILYASKITKQKINQNDNEF